MSFVVAKKATLLIPSGPDPDGHHLFVVLTSPCTHGQCLLTSFSSVKPGLFHDKTCLVAPGEHEFITKDSFIEYRLSRVLRCDQIEKAVNGWLYTPKPAVSDELLERIRDGIEQSELTPRFVQEYFEKNKRI
ncbi:hypothetical protein [Devosia sp.]|uniref:hypothetical protein n=1 Tax=Devosia sp. TaxID=1871048 RepID=UPI001AC13E4B|nr:hypothetical protein [Devosia sp.]MBN9309308.1 hypothetical protein [Devosia sp.]